MKYTELDERNLQILPLLFASWGFFKLKNKFFLVEIKSLKWNIHKKKLGLGRKFMRNWWGCIQHMPVENLIMYVYFYS